MKPKVVQHVESESIIYIFYSGNVIHNENINNAIQFMKNLSHDVSIISGDNEEIQTNKYLLSVFSHVNMT